MSISACIDLYINQETTSNSQIIRWGSLMLTPMIPNHMSQELSLKCITLSEHKFTNRITIYRLAIASGGGSYSCEGAN